MKKILALLFFLFCLTPANRAAVLPVEKLLPDDTLLLISVPDATKLRATFSNSPQGQFWNDLAMKPFKDNFWKKFNADMTAPLEKELGVKFEDYTSLAQGECAFALTQNGF